MSREPERYVVEGRGVVDWKFNRHDWPTRFRVDTSIDRVVHSDGSPQWSNFGSKTIRVTVEVLE